MDYDKTQLVKRNKKRALKMDRNGGDFYVEDDVGLWCVFGTESGFCYSTFADETEAEEEAKRMREQS